MRIIKIKAKKAFSPSRIPGADYVINQYIGCQHACAYCYAKFMRRWYNYGKWGEWVVARENLPELVKGRHVKGNVYMSSVSDPYQPVEAKLGLTRRILINMNKDINLSILTKSALVLRDVDIFKKFKNIEVGLTINDFNGIIKEKAEPFSSDNKERIRALKVLHENGVKNYAFVSPIIPDLIDIGKLIDKTKDFVDFYWFELLNLRASGSEFNKWLMKEYSNSYDMLKRGDKDYLKEIAKIIKESNISSRGIYNGSEFFSI